MIGARSKAREPYKLKPFRISIRIDELVYVPVCHPLRCHRKLVIAHRHPQQRQHVGMSKRFPGHDLLTESLHGPILVGVHELSTGW